MSTNHNFWRERRAEAVSNQGPSTYQPTALPLGQTGSRREISRTRTIYSTETHTQMSCIVPAACPTHPEGFPTYRQSRTTNKGLDFPLARLQRLHHGQAAGFELHTGHARDMMPASFDKSSLSLSPQQLLDLLMFNPYCASHSITSTTALICWCVTV